MIMSSVIRNNFTGGKLSPYLLGRSDLAQFRGGLSKINNFNVLPYGGLGKRGGFGYVATSNIVNDSRLIPFEFSVNTTYLIEYGHERIDIWDGSVLKSSIVTNFNATLHNVFDLQYTQINDILYLVHPDYPVYRLSRVADTNWVYTKVNFKFPPVIDDNTTDTTVYYNGSQLIASTGIFDSNDINTQFTIKSTFPASNLDLGLSGPFTSVNMPVFKTFNIQTTGTWSGNIVVQKSLDGGSTWVDMLILSGREDRNIQTSGDILVEATDTVTRRAFIRVVYTYFSHVGNPRVHIWGDSYEDTATFNITGYNNPSSVNAVLYHGSHNGQGTKAWAFAAFNSIEGYPGSITLHDQRLILAGTRAAPQTLWMSAIDDFENFLIGSNDDDAIQVTIAAQDKNIISYIQSAKVCMVGTLGGEYTISGDSLESAITPNNVTIRRHTNFGSKNIKGILYDDKVIFVQRQGNKLREVSYQFETDGFVSPDLSILAEDLLIGGIKNIAYSGNPFGILYIVMQDSKNLVTMTYESDQGARGYSLISTANGEILDVAVLRSSGFDRVMVLVKRNGVKYIEQISEARLPELSKQFYLDNYRVYSGSLTNTITGLSNFVNQDVTIYNNNTYTVSTGSVSSAGTLELNDFVNFVTIGYPISASFTTMPIDVEMEGSTRRDKYNKINKCNLYFLNTTSGSIRQFAIDDYSMEYVDFNLPALASDGTHEVFINNKHSKDIMLEVTDYSPYDFNILFMVSEYNAVGN
jgi:hypothetical protein